MKPTNENLPQRIREAIQKELGKTENWTFEQMLKGIQKELNYQKGIYDLMKKHKLIKEKFLAKKSNTKHLKKTYCQWCGKSTYHTKVEYNSGIGTCTECGHVRNPDKATDEK